MTECMPGKWMDAMYIQSLELSCMAIKYNLLTICCKQPSGITTHLVTLVLVSISKQTNKQNASYWYPAKNADNICLILNFASVKNISPERRARPTAIGCLVSDWIATPKRCELLRNKLIKQSSVIQMWVLVSRVLFVGRRQNRNLPRLVPNISWTRRCGWIWVGYLESISHKLWSVDQGFLSLAAIMTEVLQ